MEHDAASVLREAVPFPSVLCPADSRFAGRWSFGVSQVENVFYFTDDITDFLGILWFSFVKIMCFFLTLYRSFLSFVPEGVSRE